MSTTPPARQRTAPFADPGEGLVHISTAALIALRHVGEGINIRSGRIIADRLGTHHSRFRGRGMEYEESRGYLPGDDIRAMDWRVTARTGKPHTKLFREERERITLAWIDMRSTMAFATCGAFKRVVAARAAAIVAWAAQKQGDRTGGLIFTDQAHTECRPRRGKSAVLSMINGISASSRHAIDPETVPMDTDQPLLRLRRVSRPGSLIFMFSDFRNLGPMSERHLLHLARHSDLIMCHIHDPLETSLPSQGPLRAVWGHREITFDPADHVVRERVRKNQQRHMESVQRIARFPGIHLIHCPTDADLPTLLKQGLIRRQ